MKIIFLLNWHTKIILVETPKTGPKVSHNMIQFKWSDSQEETVQRGTEHQDSKSHTALGEGL